MNETACEALPPIGSTVPLLFTYRDTLFVEDCVVEVQARHGRALCVHETDGFWMYGVNPGGLAATGENPDAAHAEFRKAFSRILVDLAFEAPSLKAFRAAVEQFFAETNAGYEPDWFGAVERVRRREIVAVGIPRIPADSHREVTVTEKVKVSVADNQAEFEASVAA